MLFLFRTLVAWRRFIVVSALVAAVVMAAVSLVLPKWYTASTTIFPPEAAPGASMYAELLQNVTAPLLGQLGSGTAPETIYIDMLKSRSISEQVIREFNLMEVYHTGIIEQALEQFQSHCGYTLLVNGLVVFTFEDHDAERAAAVANRMVELLDEFNRNMKMSRAGRTREFVEAQLDERKSELESAETALRDFQERNKALDLDEQLHSAMNIVASLTGRAIALETELEIMSHYTSTTSEEYARKKTEYDEVVRQLAKLKVGGERDEDMVRSYIPTLNVVPELALEMLRLKRNVEIESAVYTMLVKEFERSRIEEARDTPTVQILDHASVPNLRSRPQRKMLVIIAFVVGAAWAAFVALFVTVWRGDGRRAQAWRDAVAPLRSDVLRVLRRRGRRS